MCVRIALITPDPCEARAFTSGEAASFTTFHLRSEAEQVEFLWG